MANKLKLDLSLNNVINCAVYAIIGLLLLILQGGSLDILMTVVGVLFVVLGVMDIVKNQVTKGIVEAVIGIAIIVCGWLIADIVLLIFGIVLIVKGAMEIIKNFKSGINALISPIVTVVIGVLLVVAKWALMDVLCIIAGVVFLINAALTLFGQSLAK